MAIVRTQAFVLKAFRFGETSMIYRLLTRDRGVVPVIAKGARRPKSRIGAAIAPFRRLDVTYYERAGREIQTLSQAEVLADHRAVLESLERLDAAGQWFRFLRTLLPDGAPAEPLFALAADALDRLDPLPPARLGRWQAFHRAAAAARLGLAARLDACTGCGSELPDGRPLRWSAEEGGLACASCAAPGGGWGELSSEEYALLAIYHQPDWGLLEQLDGREGVERRVQDLVNRFVAWHADVHPTSPAPR